MGRFTDLLAVKQTKKNHSNVIADFSIAIESMLRIQQHSVHSPTKTTAA